ncbi:hypothetical protein L1987_57724 [Smallanthus sonchifolius]|uniref:Uncharacterized protein n=1 Tax=Smallanthus sonchifolius TaxID=185202 RepID=A0ACB9DDU6_9ASTR|nr:hypothetical protein L1987_57724 [Smallanthus sonchifolius]
MGDIIPQSISFGLQATNNEAEYEALIAGLQLAKDMRIRYLQVCVDSLLIANHFNGSYAAKGEKLAQYLEIVKNLAKEFEIFSIEQVHREDNAEADALAIGKLPKAPGGKVFMLAMTDYFSKWIEAEAFVQVRDKEVVSFIKRNILTRFGKPSKILGNKDDNLNSCPPSGQWTGGVQQQDHYEQPQKEVGYQERKMGRRTTFCQDPGMPFISRHTSCKMELKF